MPTKFVKFDLDDDMRRLDAEDSIPVIEAIFDEINCVFAAYTVGAEPYELVTHLNLMAKERGEHRTVYSVAGKAFDKNAQKEFAGRCSAGELFAIVHPTRYRVLAYTSVMYGSLIEKALQLMED
ncbi:unnamed protein product [Sphagnum jensenii]|uniref:Uncharacterized protein n=1 Tax=Sphagnum jensenii TaxID=128206 RepID=A0ABP0VB99_9BRYO